MPSFIKAGRTIAGRIHPLYWALGGLFAVVFLGMGASAWYGYQEFTQLSTHIAKLEDQLRSNTTLLQENIAETESTLSEALREEKERVESVKGELKSTQQQVGSVAGTVTTLEKLSKTDPELLQKYSKVFFLNEHYAPDRLFEIPDKYEYYEYKHTKIQEQIWPYFKNLLDAAEREGVTIYVVSGFRSFNEQQALKGIYTVIYGEGTANQFAADQGYSEHQLGTTVDLITTGLGGEVEGFERTAAYAWLLGNAHKYGFVLSYPENNSHYVFEPWHWRFVGVRLATDLKKTGAYFYDWDQRKIDEYLVSIFD